MYVSVDGQSLGTSKVGAIISEIHVERSHSMLCTNRHKTDITAVV